MAGWRTVWLKSRGRAFRVARSVRPDHQHAFFHATLAEVAIEDVLSSRQTKRKEVHRFEKPSIGLDRDAVADIDRDRVVVGRVGQLKRESSRHTEKASGLADAFSVRSSGDVGDGG